MYAVIDRKASEIPKQLQKQSQIEYERSSSPKTKNMVVVAVDDNMTMYIPVADATVGGTPSSIKIGL